MDQALLAKIEKCLALARRGGTEAEADTAMRKVHELLAAHNLSMMDIEAAKEKPEDYMWNDLGAAPRPWQRNVYHAIARLYFCDVLTDRRKRTHSEPRLILIGKPSNVAIVKHMVEYLIPLGDNLALQAGGQDREFRTSFKNGFSSRINERVTEELRRAKAGQVKDETGRALILAPLYERTGKELKLFLNSQLDGNSRVSNSSRGSQNRSAEGHAAGREAGDRVALRSNGIAAHGKATLMIGG